MTRSMLGVVLAAGVLSWAAVPAGAHHSFAAEFDSNKPVTLTGTITKVEFQNPHIYFCEGQDESRAYRKKPSPLLREWTGPTCLGWSAASSTCRFLRSPGSRVRLAFGSRPY